MCARERLEDEVQLKQGQKSLSDPDTHVKKMGRQRFWVSEIGEANSKNSNTEFGTALWSEPAAAYQYPSMKRKEG